MKTLGVIVEYNPLHNGHVLHFRESRKKASADAVVAVMSGHFLQRGEPAIVNKWARTEMALNMGADLVIELPVAFSSQPAEWFAFGAVSALEATGLVDALCFGSESGEIDWLRFLAGKLYDEPEAFRMRLKEQLGRGVNYPLAYNSAVMAWVKEDLRNLDVELPDPAQWSQPNNTLGLHYLIALKRLGSRIEPLTIARRKAGYHQREVTDHKIASATAIRDMLIRDPSLESAKRFVPAYTLDILRREREAGRAPVTWERFGRPLYHQLFVKPASALKQIHEVTEGMEHRIRRQLARFPRESSLTVEALLGGLKTKRYTRTKLQRMLLRILLEHDRDDLSPQVLRQGVPYLRILGMSSVGMKLLKRMKKTARVPVVQKVTRHMSGMLDMDIRASAVYALAYEKPAAEDFQRDYIQSPLFSGSGSDAR